MKVDTLITWQIWGTTITERIRKTLDDQISQN